MPLSFAALDKPQTANGGIAGMKISLGGLLNLTVDAIPVRRPNSKTDTATRLTCPDGHDQPTRVEQRYVCPDGHTNGRGALGQARELPDGTLVAIDRQDRKAAVTGDLPRGVISIDVRPAAQVAAFTLPAGPTLRLRPQRDKTADDVMLYHAFLELASNSEWALVGPMSNGDTRHLWWVRAWNGQLLVEARVETAELAPPDDIPFPADTEKAAWLAATAAELAVGMLADFEPDEYRHDAEAAIDALARQSATTAPAAAKSSAPTVDSLIGQMEDMIAKQRKARDARAAKAKPAKKAPARRAVKAS